MRRIAFPLLGICALATAIPFTAEARDGCGRGRYFNGFGCVPMRQYHAGPFRYRGGPAPNFYGNVVRPTVGRDGVISCSNPRYTWQDGACKPYRGPYRSPYARRW